MKKVIIVVVLAILVFFGFKSCNSDQKLTDIVKDTAGDALNTAKNAGEAVIDTAKDAGSAVADTAKDAGSAVVDTAKDAGSAVADTAKDAGNAVVDTAKDAGDLAADTVKGAGNALKSLGDFFKAELPGGISLNIPKFGVENKLIGFIKSDSAIDKTTWFDFDRINFNTGSSTLSEDSKEQVSNIAAIMKAYPAVNLKVGGYTDNTGSDEVNLNISKKRAEAVKGLMVQLGVDGSRLDAEGYGSANPIAPNDTAEGRKKNRRISLRVTAK